MTQILDDPAARTPAMMYLFHRVEQRLDGDPDDHRHRRGLEGAGRRRLRRADQGLGKDHPQAQRHRRLLHPERRRTRWRAASPAPSSSRPRRRSSWSTPRRRRPITASGFGLTAARVRPGAHPARQRPLLPDQAWHRQRRGAAQPVRHARPADRALRPRAHRAPRSTRCAPSIGDDPAAWLPRLLERRLMAGACPVAAARTTRWSAACWAPSTATSRLLVRTRLRRAVRAVGGFSAVLTALLTIYVALIGYRLLLGRAQLSISDLALDRGEDRRGAGAGDAVGDLPDGRLPISCSTARSSWPTLLCRPCSRNGSAFRGDIVRRPAAAFDDLTAFCRGCSPSHARRRPGRRAAAAATTRAGSRRAPALTVVRRVDVLLLSTSGRAAGLQDRAGLLAGARARVHRPAPVRRHPRPVRGLAAGRPRLRLRALRDHADPGRGLTLLEPSLTEIEANVGPAQLHAGRRSTPCWFLSIVLLGRVPWARARRRLVAPGFGCRSSASARDADRTSGRRPPTQSPPLTAARRRVAAAAAAQDRREMAICWRPGGSHRRAAVTAAERGAARWRTRPVRRA